MRNATAITRRASRFAGDGIAVLAAMSAWQPITSYRRGVTAFTQVEPAGLKAP
jgi:hypothetical protein